MAGRVQSVLVKPGQSVAADEIIVRFRDGGPDGSADQGGAIHQVSAPVGGRVTQVHVVSEQIVAPGEVLVDIEETAPVKPAAKSGGGDAGSAAE